MSWLKMEVWLFVKGHVTYSEEEPHRIKEQDNRSLPGDPHKPWGHGSTAYFTLLAVKVTEII